MDSNQTQPTPETQPQQTVQMPEAQTPVTQPMTASPTPSMPEHHGHGKKVFFIVLVIGILLIGLSALALVLSNKSQSPVPQKTAMQAVPTAAPTVILSPTPALDENALDTIDTGDPASDLQDVQKDVNQL